MRPGRPTCAPCRLRRERYQASHAYRLALEARTLEKQGSPPPPMLEDDDNDLKLTPGACRDCGIRPAPKYDRGGYVPVIVDDLCDDCRLRRRRREEARRGVPTSLRSHTRAIA